MPDVQVRYTPELAGAGDATHDYRAELRTSIVKFVAEEMSCEIDGKFVDLDPLKDVDLPVFAPQDGPCGADVVIEVAAYDDLPDRMANIEDRIKRIAKRISAMLPLGRNRVSITFVPVQRAHWVAV